ncbi:MAG: 1,4-dihydroxy-2-naphthoate octaprenyltransferase [bacterium]
MQSLTHWLAVWFTAARPHTLSASAVPVLVGSAHAARIDLFSWELCFLTLCGSLLVQIGANFTDEFADHGVTYSADKFPAPHKVIARGLLSTRAVKTGAAVEFGLATGIGVYLVSLSGCPLLAVCGVSLAVAYGYSAGPLPLGDLALGEMLVFVVMGPVMVMSTVFVQTGAWEAMAFWLSLPVAALVTAILIANNLRDDEEDRRHGRRTLVNVFGAAPVRAIYLALLALAFGTPLAMVLLGRASSWLLLPWLTLPLAFRLLLWLRDGNDQPMLHRALKGTSALHLLFGLLLAASVLGGAVLSGGPHPPG